MPDVSTKTGALLEAVQSVPCLAELLDKDGDHYKHELYLELIVYGRTYHRKRVGPYLRLLTFQPDEVVFRQDEWGGNRFFATVDGELEVLRRQSDGSEETIGEVQAGRIFGEMGVLAGVPYSTTVRAPGDSPVLVLEVQRPALRLLRNLRGFRAELDTSYRHNGLRATFEGLRSKVDLSEEQWHALSQVAQLRLLTKGKRLFEQAQPIKHLFILLDGWLRRSTTSGYAEDQDYMGGGQCFGLKGVLKDELWASDGEIMGRSEVLEIPVSRLRQDPKLEWLVRERFGPASAPEEVSQGYESPDGDNQRMLAAQRVLIETGVVDATNLLIMDMDLCVRCGNCSLACHKVHGHSRLIRRGIHIESTTPRKGHDSRSLLAPSVCLHCQDPECLTGCPTGSIQRLELGQIDIDRPTCIGCGDCATQCPYDAISLIPSRPAETANGGLKNRLLDLLRLRLDPLPPAVEDTDGLVASKCNLCASTALNPVDEAGRPKTASPVYSCEENCPTGALARINPHEYFDEIGAIEGLLRLDKTHAMGRNIHRSDPTKKRIHGFGILLTIVIAVAASAALARFGFDQPLLFGLGMRWLTGLVGLVAIGSVMTYPLRRQIYRRRAGPLRYWMPVHTYAGLIAAVLIFLHGGMSSGGLLTTALILCWDVVIVSGVVGVVCYRFLPRILTSIEGQPVLLEDLLHRRQELQDELQQAVAAAPKNLADRLEKQILPSLLSLRSLLQHITKRQKLELAVPSSIAQHLRSHPSIRDRDSDSDRQRVEAAIESAVTLNRTQALIYLHRALKLWLLPHVVSTSLMLALLLAHIVQVVVL